jgi:hypothetical protein
MPASADTLRRYGAAVNRLAEAYADLGPLVTADEAQAVDQDTRLDDAIDDYVIESRQLFTETVHSDPRAALASLGGDFRALAELGTAADGPDLTAGDGPGSGLGQQAGADFAAALKALNKWKDRVLRSALRLLQTATDHLDSYDVAWLPDRIPGVGKVLV